MSLSRIYLHMLNKSASNVICKSSIVSSVKFQQRQYPQRLLSTNASLNEKLATKSVPKQDWNRAVSEAEKIVGYPTSFLSLRWLVSDEIANIAIHLRQLIGSNHPLLKTAKNLIYNGKNNMQAWGLIVLLISKAVGHAPTVPDLEQDKSAGVLHSQRALAEITEMIRTSHLIHEGLVNLQPFENHGNSLPADNEMILGNKIALLTGDYLLGNACLQLAGLKNQELIELISSALRDVTESTFLGDRDEQNMPLPTKPINISSKNTINKECIVLEMEEQDNLQSMSMANIRGNPEKEWVLHHILSAGSLLGKSCQGAIMLAGQPEPLQKQGYLFGKNLSLAWQACIDLEPFRCTDWPSGTQFSLISAPVLFHLEYDPSLYDEIAKGCVSIDNIDFDKVRREVMTGPGLEKTRGLTRKHSSVAMKVLNELPASDARTALQNIIVAMQEF